MRGFYAELGTRSQRRSTMYSGDPFSSLSGRPITRMLFTKQFVGWSRHTVFSRLDVIGVP